MTSFENGELKFRKDEHKLNIVIFQEHMDLGENTEVNSQKLDEIQEEEEEENLDSQNFDFMQQHEELRQHSFNGYVG